MASLKKPVHPQGDLHIFILLWPLSNSRSVLLREKCKFKFLNTTRKEKTLKPHRHDLRKTGLKTSKTYSRLKSSIIPLTITQWLLISLLTSQCLAKAAQAPNGEFVILEPSLNSLPCSQHLHSHLSTYTPTTSVKPTMLKKHKRR